MNSRKLKPIGAFTFTIYILKLKSKENLRIEAELMDLRRNGKRIMECMRFSID